MVSFQVFKEVFETASKAARPAPNLTQLRLMHVLGGSVTLCECLGAAVYVIHTRYLRLFRFWFRLWFRLWFTAVQSVTLSVAATTLSVAAATAIDTGVF